MALPFIKRLFTSNLDLLLGVGEGELDAIGVPGLEGGLLREDLEATTPLLAGIEPNDLTLEASDERGGAEAGLEERGAWGSAMDPKDNPAAEPKINKEQRKKTTDVTHPASE